MSEDILFVQNNLTKCFSLHQMKISFSSCVSRLADVLEGFSLREGELFSQTIFILFLYFYIYLTVWKKVWHSMLGFYKTESGKLWFARMVSFKNMFLKLHGFFPEGKIKCGCDLKKKKIKKKRVIWTMRVILAVISCSGALLLVQHLAQGCSGLAVCAATASVFMYLYFQGMVGLG